MTQHKDDKTVAKTLWSDTLIALRRNSTDEQLLDIIGELNAKGYSDAYLVKKAGKEIDENAARRIRL